MDLQLIRHPPLVTFSPPAPMLEFALGLGSVRVQRSLTIRDRGQRSMGLSKALLGAALFLAVLALAGSSYAQQPASSSDQQPGKSVAEIAKEAKQNKTTHAKKVLTEDDLDHKGPLPRIDMDGTDNSEEIIQAIGEYHKQHTPEETEQAIHDWYDAYDSMLAAAIRDNSEIQERREATSYAGNRMCYGNYNQTNYKKCQEEQQAEMWGRRDDGFSLRNNGMLSGRIQQEFMRIRAGICRYNLRYTWFKIRNGNGNGSF
jgi:hypothetical protein